MWIRLRLDLSWSDLAYAGLACLRPGSREDAQRAAESCWNSANSIACLSVRSGFDLLLQSLELPAGSEVLMSAITIADMASIVQHHGLIPVPVDVEPKSCRPCLDSLENVTTGRARVLVVSHLFGDSIPMAPFIEFARRHNLLLIEDCAQSFRGAGYSGHPEAAAAMFSFGPIKTATALGGGLIRLRSRQLAEKMRARQASYPVQPTRTYWKKVVRYGILKMISTRTGMTIADQICRRWNLDYDAALSRSARSFSGSELIPQLRCRPSLPLLRMLRRRWSSYSLDRLRRRAGMGHRLACMIDPTAGELLDATSEHTHWVFPVRVRAPDQLVTRLRSAGFDATRQTRLTALSAPPQSPWLEPVNARQLMSEIVVVPCYPELTSAALRRLGRLLPDVKLVGQLPCDTDVAERQEMPTLEEPRCHKTSSLGC